MGVVRYHSCGNRWEDGRILWVPRKVRSKNSASPFCASSLTLSFLEQTVSVNTKMQPLPLNDEKSNFNLNWRCCPNPLPLVSLESISMERWSQSTRYVDSALPLVFQSLITRFRRLGSILLDSARNNLSTIGNYTSSEFALHSIPTWLFNSKTYTLVQP